MDTKLKPTKFFKNTWQVTYHGQVAHLNVRENIKAGSASSRRAGQDNGTPVESRFMLNGSQVQQFFNVLPQAIAVQGKVTFGEPNDIGTIRNTDVVSGALRFDVPLAFVLPAQSLKSEVDVIEIDSSIRRRLKDNLHRGKIVAYLRNHLPLGASIALHLAKKRAMVFTTPDLVIGPIPLAAPAVDSHTGRAIEAKPSTVEIALSKNQLALFEKSPLYIGVLFDLPGTGRNLVRVMANDYVEVQALAEFSLTVDESKAN